MMQTKFISIKFLISNFLVIAFLFTACGNKNESMSNEEKISGTTEKTWKATREISADGEKDKLTREEKKESITFSRNGNMKMSSDNQVMDGKWSYADNTLTLQFTGANVTESFTVNELTNEKISLVAADGSQLILEPN